MLDIDALATEPGLDAVVSELSLDARLGDRVVGTQGEKRSDVVLGRVDPIGVQQNNPVRGAALAEFLVGELAERSR